MQTVRTPENRDKKRRRVPVEKALERKGYSFSTIGLLMDKHRRTLASNYAERIIKWDGKELDPRDIVRHPKRLAFQALLDNEEWKDYHTNNCQMLRSEFSEIRQSTAMQLVAIVYDHRLLGEAEAKWAALALVENDSPESRNALRLIGFTSSDIAKLRLAKASQRDEKLEQIMRKRGLLD